jgi:hypothetical protein
MIRYHIILLLLFIATNTSGQENNKKFRDGTGFSLRTNPLSCIEADANIMVGVGIQWSPRLATTIEPAYIFGRLYGTSNNTNDTETGAAPASGIKLRTDLRYYFTDFRYGGRSAFFFGPEFHYKYVNTWIEDEFGINCIGNNCAYRQRAEYKETKEELGGFFKFGVNTPFVGDRVAMEFFWGLGFKWKWRRESGIPVGGSFTFPPDARNNNLIPREGLMMMMPMGMKLSFRVGNRY